MHHGSQIIAYSFYCVYHLSHFMYAPWITSVLALSHPLVRALINANRNHPKQSVNLSVKLWFLRTPSVNAWLCLRDCSFYEYQERINIPLPKSTCYYERVFVTCNSQLYGQQARYGSVLLHVWSQDKHAREYYKPQSHKSDVGGTHHASRIHGCVVPANPGFFWITATTKT